MTNSIALDFAHESVPAQLPADVALCLFRVTEESLANIAKHSHAKSARVHLRGGSGGLFLTIQVPALVSMSRVSNAKPASDS